jgi:Predicted hydrolases or acyltransferases (alpha/beta hydrolase superfamily)
MPEEFCDVGRGVTLCYEAFGDPEDTPILLIMGLATQMIAWHEDFCEQLAERGFYVVFDNRDIGRSTHFGFRPPTLGQMMRRRVGPEQYTLSDMAEDSAGLLRELDIAPAHVVGASMGGMIGQMLAAEHPEVVRSLTSIMSTTGSRWHGQPALSVYRYLLRPPPRDRDGYIERSAEVFGLVGSTGFDRDEQYVRERAGHSYDRGFDVRAGGRQLGAIVASGDRTNTLGTIRVPTLVIHGTVDKMVRPSGGRATANAIPGARLMMIEGMGHDLPRGVWPQIIDAVAEHARASDYKATAHGSEGRSPERLVEGGRSSCA